MVVKRLKAEIERIELELFLHDMTQSALAVSTHGYEEDIVWLPLSEITYELKGEDLVEVILPVWLAETKGLL